MRYGGSEGAYGGGANYFNGATLNSSSFTGPSSFGSGTKASPGIQWTADPDTGPYWRQANTYTVAIGGAESLQVTQNQMAVAGGIGMAAAGSDFSGVGTTAGVFWAAANSLLFAGSNVTTNSRTEINKAVTAFTDAVAKATFTVTIPNAQHAATLEIEVTGILGAGGAIGAGEATATNSYKIVIARTAGVATVATISAAYGAAASAVVGAATVTATAAVSAIAGAVGATQTFTVNVTITRSGGSSDNHTAQLYGKLMNANVTGVTIA